MPPAIAIRGLGKRYRLGTTFRRMTLRERLLHRGRGRPGVVHPDDGRELWALRDVSLDIAPGDVVALIGRNGAGKSTLLRILSEITEPTTGEVRLTGRVASMLEVGTGFHPDLTGRENVYLNGAILGMTRREIRARFDEIVAFAGVAPFIDTPVKRFSSGMVVRLAFAVAAHLEAEIMLVDEVLAVGDAEFQRKCIGKIGDVAGSGRTIIFVSHNMAAVASLCRRAVLFERGRVLEEGRVGDMIARYATLQGVDVDRGAAVGEFDLEHRRNPCLGGAPLITRLRLQDARGTGVAGVPMGGALRIALDLRGLGAHPGAHVGVVIRSDIDQTLCTLNSAMAGRREASAPAAREEAVLDIPRLPLTPGRYTVEVHAAQQGARYIDRVERAGIFEVYDADVYGSGAAVGAAHGLIFLDGEWRRRPLDD